MQSINRVILQHIYTYLTEKDIKRVIQYPKIVGKHNKKDVILHIGPYGLYMKYNNKNYRIPQKENYELRELINLI